MELAGDTCEAGVEGEGSPGKQRRGVGGEPCPRRCPHHSLAHLARCRRGSQRRGPTPQSSLEAAERRRLSKSELFPSGRVSDVRGHPPSKISVVLRAPYLERRVSASQAARRTAEQKARLNSEALKCEKKTSVSGWMRFGTGNGACDTRPHAGRDSPFAWLCRARHRGPRHLSLLSREGSGLCGTGALWGERSRGLFSSSPRFSGEPRGITNFSGLAAAAGTS